MIIADFLIENKEESLAVQLIANSLIHDNSKLHGVEWHYLRDDVKKNKPYLFKAALQNHITTNLHHPESWPSIHHMTRLYVAEFVSDINARANEFGISSHDWLKTTACKKFNMKPQDKIYREILEFKNILLDRPFE